MTEETFLISNGAVADMKEKDSRQRAWLENCLERALQLQHMENLMLAFSADDSSREQMLWNKALLKNQIYGLEKEIREIDAKYDFRKLFE